MKRFISLILALLMIVSAVAMTACGNEIETEAPTEAPTEEVTEESTENTEENTVKNAMIFGDSYSTFAGYVPENFVCFYSENERIETDVTKVEQTWWYQVMEETGMNLVQNNSWSASSIGYTGYNGADTSETHSFIFRLRNLINEGFFEENKIDVVFLFGGTNDSWSGAPLGEMKEYEDIVEEDLYNALPAMCYFTALLRETLPDAKIYCLINNGLKPEITNALSELSDKHGMTKITFDKIAKFYDHPTIVGMVDIKNQIMAVINEEEK